MAAAKVLRYTVVRENPETMQAEAMLVGTKKADLPKWAQELVQDDDFGAPDGDDADNA